jgi:RND family efflux transporter MFP subunit
MQRILIALLFFSLVAGGVLLVRHRREQIAAAPVATLRPTLVRVETARLGALEEARPYLARVSPWQTARISAQVAGRVQEVRVREGDRVRRGQVLAVLDDAEVRSALDGAEAQVAQARARALGQEATVATLESSVRYWEGELRRDEVLAREGAIARAAAEATADRLREVRGQREAARRAWEAAQREVEVWESRRADAATRLSYSRVESPFDGVIARRLADPGDLAAPGAGLLVVEDHSRLRVAVDVPQEDLPRVREGAEIHLHGGVPGGLRVSRRYASLNPDRTLTVEADAAATGVSGLVPGAVYPASLILGRLEGVVLVPEACVAEAPARDGAGGTAVFVVVDGRTRPVPVRVLLVRDGLAAVEGIPAGTAVVRTTYLGWNRLAEGEAVEVVP